MKSLQEITTNLQGAIDKYETLNLDDVLQLSEILRTLDVNLSYLVHVRDVYYKSYQSVYYNSAANSDAAKKREAEHAVLELDLVRKILKVYGDVQSSIRSQISLRKKND